MRRLLLTVTGIAALNAVAGLTYVQASRTAEPRAPWETSAVLQVMPHGQHTGAVILGTSHARTLSWCPESAAALEQALGCDVVNLAKNAAGPMPLRLYFEEFLARGNSADTLIYIADPWAFYAKQWNEEHGFLTSEPFDVSFFARCIQAGRSRRQLFHNARAGFLPKQFLDQVEEQAKCESALPAINDAAIQHRVQHLYRREPAPESLERTIAELDAILDLAKKHHMKIRIVTPPTLLGDLPGMDAFVEAIERSANQHGATYTNASNEMQDLQFFQDHDHLNTAGVAEFARHFLSAAAQ